MKPSITCMILIVFTSVLVAGCKGNSSTKEKKTDTVYIQSNSQGGEGMDGNHGGMGYDNKGADSMHRGMGHNSRGMDSIHGRIHH